MPVEDAGGGRFQWRDGPVLAGLKAGSWILFDEVSKFYPIKLSNIYIL